LLVAALCATMCASFVKNIFLRIYKLFGNFLLHCSRALQFTSTGFWKLAHCMTYLLRRNRFYHSWTAVGRGAIRLKRNDWRVIKELNF